VKRRAAVFIGIVLGVILLFFVLATVDLGQVWAALIKAEYGWVGLALVSSAFALWARAVRWSVLLNGRLPLVQTFHISNIGYMLNALMPFRAGEVARVLLSANAVPPVSMMTSVSTIVLERILDLLFLFGLLGLSLTVLPMPNFVSAGGFTLALASVAGFIFLFIIAIKRAWSVLLLNRLLHIAPFLRRFQLETRLSRFLDGLIVLTSARRFVWMLVWSIIAWSLTAASGYIMLYAFFDAAALPVVLLFIVTSSLFSAAAGAVSTIPAGIGSFQAGIVLALAITGYTEPEGAPLALAIVLHASNLALYTVFGVIGLTRQHITLDDLLARIRPKSAT